MSRGTITDTDLRGQSCTTEGDQGTFRRNRAHMRPDTTSAQVSDDSDDEDNRTAARTQPETRATHGNGYIPPTVTRSGRTVKPVLCYIELLNNHALKN